MKKNSKTIRVLGTGYMWRWNDRPNCIGLTDCLNCMKPKKLNTLKTGKYRRVKLYYEVLD